MKYLNTRLIYCRGLVTLHWSRGRAMYARAIATFWPLRPRRTVEVWHALSGQAVELKLSVWAHVFFSCVGRMKVAKTFVRESVMLPIGAASYLMWKAFRGSENCVKRMFVLVKQSGDLPVVSWPFHLWYRRGCCDSSSSSLAVVTTAAVRWWSPLKFCIRRRTFPSCWPGIWQRQWCLLGEALTRLAIVLKLQFFCVDNVVLVVYICVCFIMNVSFIFIKV